MKKKALKEQPGLIAVIVIFSIMGLPVVAWFGYYFLLACIASGIQARDGVRKRVWNTKAWWRKRKGIEDKKGGVRNRRERG